MSQASRRRKQTEPAVAGAVIYSIGHSTHPIDAFIELLTRNAIAILGDVRSFPSSRRWPQFNQEELQRSIEQAGIEYRWLKRLGGRRGKPQPDSIHVAWEHPAFRSYADYTESEDFEKGLDELLDLARRAPTAYMCAEGLWWQCHRRIISDHLVVRGWTVEHIMPDGKRSRHELTPFARVTAGRIIYDGVTSPENTS